MNFAKSKIFYIILALILIFGGVYLAWKLSKYREQQSADLSAGEANETGSEQTFVLLDNENLMESMNINEYQTYSNSKYNFSFKYPKGFTVANFQEGEYGETILIRKHGAKDAFQIFISPFDEPGSLTKERILKDVPDMVIENAENRILKNGAPGLIFFSQEPSLGRTREVWFIHNGYLYQVSTYVELDRWLANILSTWRFH
jgi:hypothetical protein